MREYPKDYANKTCLLFFCALFPILWSSIRGSGVRYDFYEQQQLLPVQVRHQLQQNNNKYEDDSGAAVTVADYLPSRMESYVMEHGRDAAMGYDKTKDVVGGRGMFPSGCQLYWNETVSSDEFRGSVDDLRKSFEAYREVESNWTWKPPPSSNNKNTGRRKDLRDYLNDNGNNQDAVCDTLELHPSGLSDVFVNPESFSRLNGIFLEPLIPPLRHPEFCYQFDPSRRRNKKKWLMDLGYLIHDFAGMCRRKIRKHSKTVFLDMGASLTFHKRDRDPPAIKILRLYEKFGIVFDHIYGYEITKQDPDEVYKNIPDDFKAAYHWFNVGVDSSRDGTFQNPWEMIADRFGPEDFVVVKLDIDTPHIENPLAEQLLAEPRLTKLVDVFYYEHHVPMLEMSLSWGSEKLDSSMQESMEFFQNLRKAGIAAHSWI